MLLKNLWVIISIVAEILSNINVGVCLSPFQNKDGFDLKNLENKMFLVENYTQNLENISRTIRNNVKINSQIIFGDIVADCMKNFIPFSKISENCTRDGQHFVAELNNRTLWALRMYESSSKYPGGTSADVTELGYFDQCLDVSSKRLGIRGAYAIADIKFHQMSNQNITGSAEGNLIRSNKDPLMAGLKNMLWALCFPHTCSNKDVQTSIEYTLMPIFQAHNIVTEVTVPPLLYTSVDSAMKYDNGFLITCGILIMGVILVITGTMYDQLTSSSKITEGHTFFGEFLRSYSLVTNMRNLTGDSKKSEFASTAGLKVLGIVSVIIGHRVALDLATPEFNSEFSDHIYTDFWLSILRSPVAVEIFFIISGFFTYIVIEERLKSGKPLKFAYLLCYRFVRILPTYITVILIFAFVLPFLGDGPLWKLIIYPEAQFCRKNWWTNLLFINNYVNSKEICMVHSWYLACDMHFFIVGVFLTYAIWKWKKFGFLIFGALFAVSIYLPAKYIYDNKQWGVMPYFRSNMKNLRTTEHFHRVYVKSHFRITTYLIGMATAYVYVHIKKSNLKFSVGSKTIGFVISLLVHTTCYIVAGYLYLPGQTYNPWHHVLYFTVQRIVYALTISYVLVVFSLSNFGFLSSFFECKLFTIIARISYVLYLTHFIVVFQSVGQIRQPQYGSFWKLYWKINADLTTSIAYALPFNLIVEAPSRKIFNHLMNNILKNEHDKSSSFANKVNRIDSENTVLPQFHEGHKL